MNSVRTASFALVCLTFCSAISFALSQNPDVSAEALKKLSIEELLNVDVTSVSKINESLGGSAAAITVVTNEDIRRSGAVNIPQALRLAPGLHVARQTSDQWAISSRGFSSVNSEKLLVLSDTRSIYTPLFSGVFWDVQDDLLQDIDRIEIIRGPGASLWGSNAVNGVINILTKSAKDTQGVYVESGGGSNERAIAGARYGGKTEGGLYYRIFGRYFDRGPSFHSQPITSDTSWLGHLGFRVDRDTSDRDAITLQGDMYRTDIGQLTPSVTVSGRAGAVGNLQVGADGGNVLGRWRHRNVKGSEFQFRVYYDRTHRNDPSFVDNLNTVDLDFQHRIPIEPHHDIIWGANYQVTDDRNTGRGLFALQPPTSRDNLGSGFVQDQIAIFHSLRLTAGTKLEHNDFSGFEAQPSARAAWALRSDQTIWVAVSRAARIPTRLERDIAVNVSNPAGNPVVRLLGNRDFHAEHLNAYEAGYRGNILRGLSVDVAIYRNQYTGLASLEFGTNFVDTATQKTVIPIFNRNLMSGTGQGVETLLIFSPRPYWRLSASHTYTDLSLQPAGQDLNRDRFSERSTPRHQVGLRSFLDLPHGLEVDAQFRHLTAITKLPAIPTDPGLPGYSELEARLAWRGWKRMETSVVGQNLLHNHHAEFGPPASRGEIKRSVYGKIAWGF